MKELMKILNFSSVKDNAMEIKYFIFLKDFFVDLCEKGEDKSVILETRK